MYVYKRTEFSPYELYTVGNYDSGKWEPESDHSTEDEAAKRVRFLNGGNESPELLQANRELVEMVKTYQLFVKLEELNHPTWKKLQLSSETLLTKYKDL